MIMAGSSLQVNLRSPYIIVQRTLIIIYDKKCDYSIYALTMISDTLNK